jgi:thiol-disulfide isomerase/thioredoxin
MMVDMKKGVLIFWLIIVILIVAGAGAALFAKASPGQLDDFAQCIKDKEVIFYGAFWCPHCQATKRLFGNSAKLLPYVECSTPDGQAQLQVCKDKKIASYPTWMKPDGTTISGEHTLKEISDFSGCSLAQQ